jgi:hypothetical protein
LADIDLPLIEKLERPARADLLLFQRPTTAPHAMPWAGAHGSDGRKSRITVFYRDRDGLFGWRAAICAAKPGARSAKLDPILYPIAFESETLRP